jgi:Spy/CpxP family protein refolding chaperone
MCFKNPTLFLGVNMTALRLLALATLVASATPAFAQRVPVQPQPKVIGGRPGTDALLPADGVQKLKFTDEQKDKYTKIETEYKDKMKAAQDKYRNDVTTANDRTKAKEFAEEMRTSQTKAREAQLAKVETILDADQKKLFAQIKQQPVQPGVGVRPLPIQGGAGGINPLLPPGIQNRLQLTDEQKKQVDAIQKEVEEKILKVLTDEQKKTLEQMKKGTAIRPVPRPVQPRQIRQVVPNVDPALPNSRKD